MDPFLKLFKQLPRVDWQWELQHTSAWSKRNALAMANLALLAYSDFEKVDKQLKARGFIQVVDCSSDHHSTDTQAFLSVRPDALFLMFRGTEPTYIADFATDFDAKQVSFESKFGLSGWGRIHEGWAEGVSVVLLKVIQALAQHSSGTRPLWIAGHSLGGALAMVTAAILANEPSLKVAGVYTFGQPRVGDRAFRIRYEEMLGEVTYRCVNNRDLVPHLPPREMSRTDLALIQPGLASVLALATALATGSESTENYEHAGQLRLLLEMGGFSDNLDAERALEPDFVSGVRTARSFAFALPPFLANSPQRLKDHAPINHLSRDGYVDRIAALVAS